MHARDTPQIDRGETNQIVITFAPATIIPEALLLGATGHSGRSILKFTGVAPVDMTASVTTEAVIIMAPKSLIVFEHSIGWHTDHARKQDVSPMWSGKSAEGARPSMSAISSSSPLYSRYTRSDPRLIPMSSLL